MVDGRSTDDTRARATGYPRVRVLDNPARMQSAALNIGLHNAVGDIIVRVDGHCVIEPDYVARCVEALEQTGAAMVGGAMAPDASTPVQEGIAAAMASRFGAGPARFHVGGDPGWVDTVYLGAYRRAAALAIGGYATDVGVNEDAEARPPSPGHRWGVVRSVDPLPVHTQGFAIGCRPPVLPLRTLPRCHGQAAPALPEGSSARCPRIGGRAGVRASAPSDARVVRVGGRPRHGGRRRPRRNATHDVLARAARDAHLLGGRVLAGLGWRPAASSGAGVVDLSRRRRDVNVTEGSSPGRVRFGPEIFRIQRHGGVSRYVVEVHRGLLARGVDSGIVAGLHRSAMLDGVRAVSGRNVDRIRPTRLVRP